MSNLSFARIMYGTSQEPHSTASMPVSNFESQSLTAASPNSDRGASGLSIEGFFHKAWMAISAKK
ncbi:MAG TPA: hypothetical protein VJX70_10865 [Candidatus Acidoferrum sp.]|nr:hypothetical protein [Candidatus Acidoferrum sp.]